MTTVSPPPALASAAVVFFGRYGDVVRLAREREVPRQALYRQAHALIRVLEQAGYRQELDRLRRQTGELSQQLAATQEQLRQAAVPTPQRLEQFVATAQALGVSLSPACQLLQVIWPGRLPSRAVLGRLAQAAGGRAAAVLAVLDRVSRRRARQVAADEIFAGRKPVLMTVEQESLCWLGGRLADDRTGPTWAAELRQLPALEQLTRDGGQGLRKGLAEVNRERREANQASAGDQEDHFHLLYQSRRALHTVRQKAVRALHKAEETQKALDHLARHGRPRTGGGVKAAAHRWRVAESAFDRWAAQERAFGRLRAALTLFTPEGELNTRARAEADVQAALAELTGPEWTRARRRLMVPETFTFLDRVHEQIAAVPLPEPVKAQAARAEGLRRRPELLRGDGPQAAALRGVVLAAAVAQALLEKAGQFGLDALLSIIRGAWRASSLVEGLNSVVRMHQSRQKRLTQGLLDLKRLHWNLHRFTSGRRKNECPYGRLGLLLPPGDWWDLLNRPPEQLQQQLSALNPAP
jgi:hypothetical protein